MADKKTMKGALRLLKKARAWFKSEDRIVKDWHHWYENETGPIWDASSDEICRACILGSIGRVVGKRWYQYDERESLADRFLRANRHSSYFIRRHSLREVRDVYDAAIKSLEKEIASAA
jgi:hypothetical protein